MEIINGVLAMLSVIIASVINSVFLVALIAGIGVGVIRGRIAIATAMRYSAPAPFMPLSRPQRARPLAA